MGRLGLHTAHPDNMLQLLVTRNTDKLTAPDKFYPLFSQSYI